jgi:tetratricopeptide (TPR) repeat protein
MIRFRSAVRNRRTAVCAALLAFTGLSLQAQTNLKPSKQPKKDVVTATSGEQAAQAQAQRQVLPNELLAQLDGNPRIFAVLAAINAAGYDADLDSLSNHPLRKAVRDYVAKQNIPSLFNLKRYVRDHKQPTEEANFGQYISFALLSKGAPDFGPAQANIPMPPDADAIRDFAPLMAAFYREANIEALWKEVQPYYDEALSHYTEPVTRAVTQVDAYLKVQPTNGSHARFQVFVDLLGAPNQVQTRTYVDQYYVVVTPAPEPRIEDIRHHYLHFQSESLGFKYPGEVNRLKPLGDYALASPILEQKYREDFPLLAIECFIKAVEARLDRNPAAIEQAKREGFVLTPAFADQLIKYVAQPISMRLYFGDMAKAINMQVEERRLDKIDFITQRSVRTIRVTGEVAPPVLTGVAKMLDDGDEFIRKQDVVHAKEIFSAVLTTTAERPPQARAFYGLARAALIESDPEKADGLFRKVLDTDPDASTQAWSLLYLGKLADSQGEGDAAKEFYQRALAVAGLPDQVKREAGQGITGTFFRARRQEQE